MNGVSSFSIETSKLDHIFIFHIRILSTEVLAICKHLHYPENCDDVLHFNLVDIFIKIFQIVIKINIFQIISCWAIFNTSSTRIIMSNYWYWRWCNDKFPFYYARFCPKTHQTWRTDQSMWLTITLIFHHHIFHFKSFHWLHCNVYLFNVYL